MNVYLGFYELVRIEPYNIAVFNDFKTVFKDFVINMLLATCCL